ncbi:hypothetical protein LINPERHAP1_LOCUS2965 [Linum perenne]
MEGGSSASYIHMCGMNWRKRTKGSLKHMLNRRAKTKECQRKKQVQ